VQDCKPGGLRYTNRRNKRSGNGDATVDAHINFHRTKRPRTRAVFEVEWVPGGCTSQSCSSTLTRNT